MQSPKNEVASPEKEELAIAPHETKQFDLNKLNTYFGYVDTLMHVVASKFGIPTTETNEGVTVVRDIAKIATDVAGIATAGLGGNIVGAIEGAGNVISDIKDDIAGLTNRANQHDTDLDHLTALAEQHSKDIAAIKSNVNGVAPAGGEHA